MTHYFFDPKTNTLHGPIDRMPPDKTLESVVDDIEAFSIYEPLWKEFDSYLSSAPSHPHTFTGPSRVVPEGEIEWVYRDMDIYAEAGSKVIGSFNDEGRLLGGYDWQNKEASKYLKKGESYTVDHTDVSGFHTDVYLKEFPGVSFNSVHFLSAVATPITEEVKGLNDEGDQKKYITDYAAQPDNDEYSKRKGESPWPFNGYAPGNYENKCSVCKEYKRGMDKLSFVCLECAVKIAEHKSSPPSPTQQQGEKDLDDKLRELGYNPEQLGKRGETLARLLIENQDLKAKLAQEQTNHNFTRFAWDETCKERDALKTAQQPHSPAQPDQEAAEKQDVHWLYKHWCGIWERAHSLNMSDFQKTMREEYSLSGQQPVDAVDELQSLSNAPYCSEPNASIDYKEGYNDAIDLVREAARNALFSGSQASNRPKLISTQKALQIAAEAWDESGKWAALPRSKETFLSNLKKKIEA